MSEILVLGARGNVGGPLSESLEALGHRVRRATRRASGSEGKGEVHLDLETGEGIEAAVAGTDAVFLLSPPGYVNQDALLGPVVDAARRHAVKKIVLMTAMGADADPTSPFSRLERQLRESGMAWNVIRPNWFMQNFNSYWQHDITSHGAIRLPTGDAKGSFIDARDIAAVAVVLLTSHEHDNQAFDLTGAESLDHHEVARVLSRESGQTIRYEQVTPGALRNGLLAAGLPPAYAEMMLMILEYFRLGYAERITDSVAEITGVAPRRFEEYARDHREAWRAVVAAA